MKYIFLILLGFINYSLHAQNQAMTMRSLEKSLLEDNMDDEGIALIKEHYKFKDDLYDFRQVALNSYVESLTKKEKLKIFRKEYAENSDYLQLLELVENSNLSKIEYLKSKYPEHFIKKSRQSQNKMFFKRKVKAKRLNSN